MAAEPSYVGTEFDIFVRKPKQSSTVETVETIYRPIASVDQTDIEFVIPGDSDTYVDLDLKLFVKGKLQNEDNTDLSETDYTAVVNNLNGTQITQATEMYPFRAYIETLSTYGNDAASSHLTMPFWLIDEGNMIGGDCSKPERMSNGGFCARWNRLKESQTVEMCGRLHSDMCNVPLFLLNGVKIQIKLTKAKRAFY